MTKEKEIALTIPSVHYTINEDDTLLLKNSELLAQASIDPSVSLNVVNIINSQGTLINNNNETWSFTPSKYFNGSLILDCIISDGTHKIVQPIMIDVIHISDSLQSPEVEFLMQEDGTFLLTTTQILQNATDIEADNLDIINMSAPQGDFRNNKDGTWTFVPGSEYLESIDLNFVVSDGQARVTQNLLVTINTPLYMPEVDVLMSENESFTFTLDDLLQNIGDIDGDMLSIIHMQQPEIGQLVNNDNGTWTFLPPANYVGPLTLQFGVSDSRGAIVDQSLNMYKYSDGMSQMTSKLLKQSDDGTILITLDDLLANIPQEQRNKLTVSNLSSTQGKINAVDSYQSYQWIFVPNNNFMDNIDLQYTIDDGNVQTAHFLTFEIAKDAK